MKQQPLGAALVLLGLAISSSFAQPLPAQDPAEPRQAKASQKPPSEGADKTELAAQTEPADEAMRQAIAGLSSQISSLVEEIGRLRRETERSSAIMELLLNEDRLAKLDDKIQEASRQKAQLDAREQDIQRRMRNIQAEVALRGGLRRDEAEASIRAELQRALEDTRAEQASCQQRVAELNDQVTRLRARVEALRKKIDQSEEKAEK